MKRGNALWRTIGIVSLLTTLLFLAGFGYAVKDMLYPEAQLEQGEAAETSLPGLADKDEIRVTALGDSLTKGTGDSTGDGYVKQTIKLLEAKYGKPVKLLNNLAINGLRADQLNEKLQKDKGFKLALSEADIILLTIGGNDLFQYAQGNGGSAAKDSEKNGSAGKDEANRAGRNGELSLAELEANLQEGSGRLEQTIKLLDAINPNARVVYVGLYNPFFDVKDLREGSLQVQDWNRQAYAVIHRYPNMRLVPTFDLFEANISRYISSDHFHPNHDGYGAIAARIVQAID